MTSPFGIADLEAHTDTRLALQSVAEHVLAADLHHHTGRIGLRATPGGFGQPEFSVGGVRRRLRVDSTSLVVLEGDHETWHPLTTLGAAAESASVRLGAPTQVFTPGTAADADAELRIDAHAATRLAAWYALVQQALEAVRRANAERSPAIVQLWPEHFDLAFSMAEVNFGASPGDDGIAEPYLYVGPWEPREGEFWTEPFGASYSYDRISSVDDAVSFFTEGLRAAI